MFKGNNYDQTTSKIEAKLLTLRAPAEAKPVSTIGVK